MVSEGLLGQFFVQLFLEDMELRMSLSQLLLELGDLLIVLLILSPVECNIFGNVSWMAI